MPSRLLCYYADPIWGDYVENDQGIIWGGGIESSVGHMNVKCLTHCIIALPPLNIGAILCYKCEVQATQTYWRCFTRCIFEIEAWSFEPALIPFPSSFLILVHCKNHHSLFPLMMGISYRFWISEPEFNHKIVHLILILGMQFNLIWKCLHLSLKALKQWFSHFLTVVALFQPCFLPQCFLGIIPLDLFTCFLPGPHLGLSLGP